MMKTFEIQAFEKAKTYREFLSLLLRGGFEKIPRGRLSEMSFRAGFSSRSFVTEVLQGKKRLTSSSLAKIASALQIKGDSRAYFEALVAAEEKCVHSDMQVRERKILSEADLNSRIEKLRIRILQKSKAGYKQFIDSDHSGVKSLQIFCVYAALGDVKVGASLEEILSKTCIDPASAKQVLRILADAGFIRAEAKRFFATDRAFDFQNLGENVSFVSAFVQSAQELAKEGARLAREKESLVFLTAIPVNRFRLDEFKNKLRSTVLDVLDEFQDEEGTAVKKIVLAMHS